MGQAVCVDLVRPEEPGGSHRQAPDVGRFAGDHHPEGGESVPPAVRPAAHTSSHDAVAYPRTSIRLSMHRGLGTFGHPGRLGVPLEITRLTLGGRGECCATAHS